MILIQNPKLTLETKKDFIERCVKIISMNWYLTGKTDRPITDRQATIVALYVMYGDFYETSVGKRIKVDKKLRVKVSSILNFENRTIDSHNHTLRKGGYIEEDDYTRDIKRLSSIYTSLKEELDRTESEIEIVMTFNVQQ